MAIKVKTIREVTSTVTVRYGGEEATVTYREGIVDPSWIERSTMVAVRVMLSEILINWDVVGDDGKRLVPGPVDLEDPAWRERIISRRVAQAIIDAESARSPYKLTDEQIQELRDKDFDESEFPHAIELAWIEIMQDLSQAFLLTVFDAIMEDIRPSGKRKPASGGT